MKTERLKEIIAIVERAAIDVLEIEEKDFRLYYQKNGTTRINGVKSTASETEEMVNEEINSETEELSQIEKDADTVEIPSPMIGTFYSRAEPGEDPYVHVGLTVKEGETVCVLEAMKLMNEVTATVNGEIVEVLVSDGDVIEYGQPLFRVKVGA